ncbi:MAG: MerR family transcriptional regulator [Bacteroidaceae bacterium]|nr:MerR family transcriptional regulator [Bacteroidaceae bacterium]
MEKDLKLYYSIKETAQIVGVPESTLRYWEKQFHELQPRKTQGGARQYTKEDLSLLKLIAHLLKDKGLTIAFAKERLKSTKQQVVDSSVVVERLKHVRDELQSMLDELK